MKKKIAKRSAKKKVLRKNPNKFYILIINKNEPDVEIFDDFLKAIERTQFLNKKNIANLMLFEEQALELKKQMMKYDINRYSTYLFVRGPKHAGYSRFDSSLDALKFMLGLKAKYHDVILVDGENTAKLKNKIIKAVR